MRERVFGVGRAGELGSGFRYLSISRRPVSPIPIQEIALGVSEKCLVIRAVGRWGEVIESFDLQPLVAIINSKNI